MKEHFLKNEDSIFLTDIEEKYALEYLNVSSLATPEDSNYYIYTFKEKENNAFVLVISPNKSKIDSLLYKNSTDTIKPYSDTLYRVIEYPVLRYYNVQVSTYTNIRINLDASHDIFLSDLKKNGQYVDVLTIEQISKTSESRKISKAYIVTKSGFKPISKKGLIRIWEECYYEL